jgi:two-component system, NarL family, nitrate/nitrite response regulator NarL
MYLARRDMSVSAPSALVSVLIADPHPLFLESLARVVRQMAALQLVAQVADGRAALERIRAQRPDIAVVALALPGLDGGAVLRAVTREQLQTRVLVLGEHSTAAPYEAIAHGAFGYLSKSATPSQLGDAIRAIAGGETVIAPEALGSIAAAIRRREGEDALLLTPRERQILALVAAGLSTPAIGSRLYLASATVKTHLRHLYDKLGVSDRAAAVAEGMRRGLLE